MGWLEMRVWHGPTAIEGYQGRPEREQAIFRSTIGSLVFLVYLGYAAGDIGGPMRITLQMIALYVIFGVLSWVAVSFRPELSITRLTLTTTLDQCIAMLALALGGRSALPLLFVVFWFLVGAGCRYGKRLLILSCFIAILGFTGLMIEQPWWVANRQVGVGLVLSVIGTSFYLYVLVHKLERRAATDPLTGLLNRSSFERLVERARAGSQASREQAAVLLIDLDGFKEVNDVLGHAAGDLLLRRFAKELVGVCNRGDAIARLGGDEFVVLARQMDSIDDARIIADRIHQAIHFVDTADDSLVVTASIGICPLEGGAGNKKLSVLTLLQKADRAMYRAKANGRGQTMFAED